MNWLGIVAVIVTGALGLAGLAVTLRTNSEGLKAARRAQINEHRARAYLELLKLVEGEGAWLDYRSDYATYLVFRRYGTERPADVPKPDAQDRADREALLAAYGSTDVRAKHGNWAAAVDAVVSEHNGIAFRWDGIDEDGRSREDLIELKDDLVPAQVRARQALRTAVADELTDASPS